MNIKQAQHLSGISADNIRFYEKQGLLSPTRNPDNDYRDYSSADIHTLKLIRALRMLDMPLDQIKNVLSGQLSLAEAAGQQKKRLEEHSRQLSGAICLCGEFAALSSIKNLDVDSLLARMDTPQYTKSFFQDWRRDYRQVALAEHEKRFTFLPDDAVTTPQEFSAALFQYAQDNGLDLVITKEGMYPEFTIDGVEYTAHRNYTAVRGCPVASIHCEVLHPEELDPKGLTPVRRILLRSLHALWLPVLLFLFLLLTRWDQLGTLFSSWKGWTALAFTLVLIGTMTFRSWLLFYNENGKWGKR